MNILSLKHHNVWLAAAHYGVQTSIFCNTTVVKLSWYHSNSKELYVVSSSTPVMGVAESLETPTRLYDISSQETSVFKFCLDLT